MLSALALFAGAAHAAPPPAQISLELLGRYSAGAYFDEGAAEIPAYDRRTQRVFVVNAAENGIDVLDIGNPAAPTRIGQIDVSPLGHAANSIDVHNGVLAAAIEADDKQAPGMVGFYDTKTLALISAVDVGALPDMLTFSPNGRYVVVANEGEPDHYEEGNRDPEGTVSVIDVRSIAAPAVRTADFHAWNGTEDTLNAAGVRIFGPGASVAQDLEPEYVAITRDSRTAYVTLQENNALAVVDLRTATVTDILPLGVKDHALPGNGLDPNDKDAAGVIGNHPVFGMYMPDSIASYSVNGREYLVTANEGDARDYDGFGEEDRVKDLVLDPAAFPDAATLQAGPLGRLTVTNATGDVDGDGDFDTLYSFGARSFSIWDTQGHLVFDSGDAFEQQVLAQSPAHFNANSDSNDIDNRSDNKGPEPEGVAVGRIGGRSYAFIGLERVGGIMVYDISNPLMPAFVQYLNPRDFSKDPEDDLAEVGDLGPEGLVFVPASDSPTRYPLLIVGNEISGTTSVFQITHKTAK